MDTEPSQPPDVPKMIEITVDTREEIDLLADIYIGSYGTVRERAILRRIVMRHRRAYGARMMEKLRNAIARSHGNHILEII